METVEEASHSAKKKKHRRTRSNLANLQENSREPRVRQQTQARFESFLQDAVTEESLQGSAKKRRKKKRTHTADSVLQTIKSGSPIAKAQSQSEENLLQANLYKKDNAANNDKGSKESYRELMASAAELDSATEQTPKKSKHRKTRTRTGVNEAVTPDDKLQKKRRKTPNTQHGEVDGGSAKENLGYEEEPTHGVGETNQGTSPAVRKKKGQRTRRRLLESLDGEDILSSTDKKRRDDGYILSVSVHRADRLKPDLSISHPMVRVHVVDIDSGNYVKKSNRGRSVISYYENDSDKPIDYIMPVMTQPYDFKKNKSLTPAWEEVLLFNDIFSSFTGRNDGDPKVIVFFELVDFLSMTAANRRRENKASEKGWYQIAWAFLKVVGGNGTLNTDRKVRLQLFQPTKSMFRAKTAGEIEVFEWWKQSKRVTYPSTLYISLKGVLPPKTVGPSLRSMYAIQQERGRVTFEELAVDAERRAHGMRDGKGDTEPTNWTRLPGQVNRIPNKKACSLPSGRRGCFVLKFSHNGRYLACGCAELDNYPIIIYEVPSGECRCQMPGHFSIIYDLCWSPDDTELLSASSDGTVRAWDTNTMMTSSIKVFPHPCFVYSSQYHPTSPRFVVTGGYDRLIRVWTRRSEGLNGQLLREIDGHSGFINSICFDQQGTRMFTADSTGNISVWDCFVNPRAKKKKTGTGGVYDWTLLKKITEDELQGHVINSVILHPSGLKLLVHVRNSMLYMVDLRSFTIMKRYLGALNFKEHIHSTLSACGCFVVSGSEDGRAYVWNTETGDLVTVYTSLAYQNAVSDIDFHPHDHIIAFCSFGGSQPILMYHYNAKVAKEEAKKMTVSPLNTPIKLATPEQTKVTPTPTQLTDVAQDVLRMQRVRQKLDSVLETPTTPHHLDTGILRTPGADSLYQTSSRMSDAAMYSQVGHSPRSPYEAPAGQIPGSLYPSQRRPSSITFQTPDMAGRTSRQMMGTNYSASTWGSDFSPTSFSQTPYVPHSPTMKEIPGYSVSPHAQQYLGASQRFQSAVGTAQRSQGSPGSAYNPRTRKASLAMKMTHLQEPTFSFQPGGSYERQMSEKREQVSVMYPYDASRADELTIQPGDVIEVLYKENENWWMGELADGRQGYFPSNYVTQHEDFESEGDLHETNVPSTRKPDAVQFSAVISRTGELKIVSGPEDSSDAESKLGQSARERRRHQHKIREQELGDTPEKKKSPKRKKR